MTYKIPHQRPVKRKTDGVASLQHAINYSLFSQSPDKTEPKLLTIIILKSKEHNFHFLKNETEFEVQGKWHNKRGKIYDEENAEIEVVFKDNKNGDVGKRLEVLLNAYNKKKVKEQVLYSTITPLDASSVG